MKKKFDNLKNNFVIGAQYYRPPTPLQEDWEDDFRMMNDIGIKVVKFWLYWRWVEYRKGEYDFSDYDRLFELGEKYSIKFQPNLFVESSPQWVFRKYPDCLPVSSSRQVIHTHDRISTQIGGYMPCFDHDGPRKHAIDFIHESVERYKDSPLLLCWNIWNEISLKGPEMCACAVSSRKFQRWLEEKYGTVENLNDAWKMRYGAFEDIIVPTNTMNYPLYINWRMFSAENVVWHGKWRYDAVKDVDQEQVAMVHLGSTPLWAIPGNFPLFRKLKSEMDFTGVSGHNFPGHRHNDDFKNNGSLEANYRFLCSFEDYPWANEISSDASVMGEFYPSREISKELFSYWVLLPLSMGCKGLVLWQFKPEHLGGESPSLGLIKLNGERTERSDEFKRMISFIRSEEKFFVDSAPSKQPVGILYSDKASILGHIVYSSFRDAKSGRAYIDSLNGAYNMFRRLNIPARFVYPEDITSSEIKVLYIPFTPVVDGKIITEIKSFLDNGGCVISEAGLGRYRSGDFIYEKRIPKNPLNDIFGIEEECALHEVYMKAHSSKDPKLYVPDGHAGDMDIVNNGSGRLLDKDKEMSFEYNGETFKGAFEKRSLKSKTAKVLARYSDGSVAISEKEIGNGKAIYIGSNPSIGEWREDDYNFHSLLKDLLDIPNAFTELSEKIPEKITVECLVSGNRKLFFIFSHIESDERISLVGNFKILYAVNPDKDKITNRLLTVSALSTVIIESEK